MLCEWFKDGMLPNLPSGPPFQYSAAVLKTHRLSDLLHALRKMNVSVKVKLQASGYVLCMPKGQIYIVIVIVNLNKLIIR